MRSSWALKLIRINAGVIDGDYRGEIKMLVENYGEKPVKIIPGDSYCQLILSECVFPRMLKVDDIEVKFIQKNYFLSSYFFIFNLI